MLSCPHWGPTAVSKALLSSPAPSNLSADEKEIYQQSIDEFVVPIEERALEAYESGWQKAVELGIFNAWTAKMRDALGRLNAELYPPLKEIGFELRSRGPSPLPALIQGPRRDATGHSQPYLVPAPADAGAAPSGRGRLSCQTGGRREAPGSGRARHGATRARTPPGLTRCSPLYREPCRAASD